MLSGIGVDEAKAQLILNDQRKVILKYEYDLDQPVFNDILNGMQRFEELTG
jgi:hypothetical protein